MESSSEQSADEAQQWVKLIQKALRQEVTGDIQWRMVLHAFILASSVLVLAILSSNEQRSLGLVWLLILAVFIFVFRGLLRQPRAELVFSRAAVALMIAQGWWTLLPLYGVSSETTQNLLWAIFILSSGSLPLPLPASLAPFGVFAGVGLGRAFVSDLAVFLAPLFFLLPLALLRSWYIQFQRLLLTTFFFASSKVAEHTSFQSSLLVLAWMMGQLTRAKQTLLWIEEEGAQGVSVEGRFEAVSTSSEEFAQLARELEKVHSSRGVIRRKDLSSELRALLAMATDSRARSYFFIVLHLIHGQFERKVLLISPREPILGLMGSRRLLRSIRSLADSIQVGMRLHATASVGSDLVAKSERRIWETEAELDEVIHQINNFSQEYSIILERLRQGEEPTALYEKLHILSLELSRFVSDGKLCRELSQYRGELPKERLALESFRQNLTELAEFYRHSKGIETALKWDLPEESETALEVPGREYFLAVVRTLIRTFFPLVERGGSMSVMVRKDANCLAFSFSPGESSEKEVWPLEELQVQAARLLEISKARKGGGSRHQELPVSVEITAPLADAEFGMETGDAGWILIVEDNPAIIQMYRKIIPLLGRDFECVEDASRLDRALARRSTPPMLLLTDLLLSEAGEGVEIVRRFRSETALQQVPIVVLSGQTQQEVMKALESLRVDRILQKPIGQRELFDHISEFIGHSVRA